MSSLPNSSASADQAPMLRSHPMPRRDTVLRVLTDLFIHNGARQSPAERKMQEELMFNLLREAGMVMRQEVAERIAAHPKAPHQVVALLARDDIAVSRPLLMHSPVLTDDELADIAAHTTRDHCKAIAQRLSIGERTAEALLKHGGKDTIVMVAGNAHTVLSGAAVTALAKQAQRDATLAAVMLARQDLRADVLIALFWQASSAQRMRIIEQMSANNNGMGAWQNRIAPLPAPILKGSDEHKKSVQRGLVAMLMNRRVDEFKMFFAKILGIKAALMTRIMDDETGEPFAIACKAGDFGQEAFTTMLLLYNPMVGQSVKQVFALGQTYKTLPAALSWRMLESWNAGIEETGISSAGRNGTHQQFTTRAERMARPAASPAQAPASAAMAKKSA